MSALPKVPVLHEKILRELWCPLGLAAQHNFSADGKSQGFCVPSVQELGGHSTSSLQGLLCRSPLCLCMVFAVTKPAFACAAPRRRAIMREDKVCTSLPHRTGLMLSCKQSPTQGYMVSIPSSSWRLSRHSALLPLYKACPIHSKSKAGSWQVQAQPQ